MRNALAYIKKKLYLCSYVHPSSFPHLVITSYRFFSKYIIFDDVGKRFFVFM